MSTIAAPPRRGIPLWGPLAGRLVYRNVVVGRRAWLLVLSGFFEPVFFLLGIGLGVGALVGDVSYGGELVPYKEFVALAMLAASAMDGAVYESTINVFAKLKWMKTYDGVLATPLGIRDVALGELIYACLSRDAADRPLPEEAARALEPMLERLPQARLSGFKISL